MGDDTSYFDLPTHKNSTDFLLSIERKRQATIGTFSGEVPVNRTSSPPCSGDIHGGAPTRVCSQEHDGITQQVSAPVDGGIDGSKQLKLKAAPLLHDTRASAGFSCRAKPPRANSSDGGATASEHQNGDFQKGNVRNSITNADPLKSPITLEPIVSNLNSRVLTVSSDGEVGRNVAGIQNWQCHSMQLDKVGDFTNAHCLVGDTVPVVEKVNAQSQITHHQSTNTTNHQTNFLNPSTQNPKITMVHCDSATGQNTAALSSQALVAATQLQSNAIEQNTVTLTNLLQPMDDGSKYPKDNRLVNHTSQGPKKVPHQIRLP
ncbi:hypothetical protein HAX54_007924 [Datura stramonium]|uniref:Uncharacterized protein n=1 Tax=Datura stramonium TaxID=4076 RepID=A0ABS8WYZ2_DATST|nr:hypothetical protein [Datura stramonium]